MKKLTFKEYYESKESLRKACENPPIVKSKRTITEYCKLRIGSGIDSYVRLKPKDEIEVKIELLETPKILNININEELHQIFWKYAKIQKWLKRNSIPVK